MSDCVCSSNSEMVTRIDRLENELKETKDGLMELVDLVRKNVSLIGRQQESSEALLAMIDKQTEILAELKGRRLTD